MIIDIKLLTKLEFNQLIELVKLYFKEIENENNDNEIDVPYIPKEIYPPMDDTFATPVEVEETEVKPAKKQYDVEEILKIAKSPIININNETPKTDDSLTIKPTQNISKEAQIELEFNEKEIVEEMIRRLTVRLEKINERQAAIDELTKNVEEDETFVNDLIVSSNNKKNELDKIEQELDEKEVELTEKQIELDKKLNDLIEEMNGLNTGYAIRDEDTHEMVVEIEHLMALNIKFDKVKYIKEGTFKKIDEMNHLKTEFGICKTYNPNFRPVENMSIENLDIKPEIIYLFSDSAENLSKLKTFVSEKIMEIDPDLEIDGMPFMFID